MNYNECLINYINKCPYDEPIFIEEIKDYFKKIIIDNFETTFKNIYVYINRLVKENKLSQFIKGIYYKPIKGKFGNKLLNVNKVIEKKYICDEKGQKGYFTGAYLSNKIGLTTQIPKKIIIVTNECPNANEYNNKNLGVAIRKPKIEINEDNYKYLQLLDILINKDDIKIEVDSEKEIIYKFIEDNKLDFRKIFEYANKINNIKPIIKLYELGGKVLSNELLEELILNVNKRTGIRIDILEKDYYVCLVLKDLSCKQEKLQAYFKGGTAVYKILNHMNRFSEDIDLTVKINENESNNSNRTRLKKSALGYKIDGLELIIDETIDKKGSITSFYKYNSLFALNELFKSEKLQIESTSFTVSEPISTYTIEPLIYKYALENEKKILKEKYN